ncbi:MAG: DUF3822 family protein [Bacteroidales bacterium]|nr:DUF3822 family protein [Bacteroidales bacterium]
MEKIAIVDETFDPFRCESYNLSVQISMVGYKICVIDTVRDCVILLITSPFDVALSASDDWGNAVNNLFAQNEVLSHKYKNVFFTFESPIFTIAPTELFVPEKSKMLLDLVHHLPDLFEVRYNHVKELNATVIYALPTSLASNWFIKQPKTKFIGYSTPLVTLSALAKLSKDEPINYTYFSEQCFINVIAKNKELLYCNSFTLYDINDTAYHLLNSCKLLGFDPNKMDIAINGSYNQMEALESFLAQYFKKVSSNSVLDAHNFAYAIAKYKNIHWNLFNLTLCE